MTRTSTFLGVVAPTRSTSQSWSTRNRRDCMVMGNSPISSRKSVPEEAASTRPALPCLLAPEKLPGT